MRGVDGKWLLLAEENGPETGWVESWRVIPREQAGVIDFKLIDGSHRHADYNARGLIRIDGGDLAAAVADFGEAIRRRPAESAYHSNRGVARTMGGEFNSALADFGEAIRLDPADSEASRNRGTTRSGLGDLARALADNDEAIRLAPGLEVAYFNRGNAWRDQKMYEKALRDHDTAIRLEPGLAALYVNRGVVWNRTKAYAKAFADHDTAIRLAPEEPLALNGRAWVYATCPDGTFRDGTKAVELAARACALSGWKIEYYIGTLAAAYAEVGDFDKAVEFREKAITLYTEEPKQE